MKTTKKLIYLFLLGLSTIVTAQTKKIDTEKSNITWIGHKVVGSHTGDLKFKSGELTFEKKKLVGGSFIVDMNSISTTDLSGKGKERLDGHLKNEDFFDVANHPEASLKITSVKAKSKDVYQVEGNITIKGITEKISFELKTTDTTAKSELSINRVKHDIKYRSGSVFPELADKAIKDEFDLNITIVY